MRTGTILLHSIFVSATDLSEIRELIALLVKCDNIVRSQAKVALAVGFCRGAASAARAASDTSTKVSLVVEALKPGSLKRPLQRTESQSLFQAQAMPIL